MYWKTADLKDDIAQSKDDFHISRMKFMEDAYINDDLCIYVDSCSITQYERRESLLYN